MKFMQSWNKQKGSSFVEVLVTLVVLGVGITSLAVFQSSVSSSNIVASQRTEAMHFAQQKIESMKNLTNGGGTRSQGYLALNGVGASTVSGKNTTYTVSWSVVQGAATAGAGDYKTVNVTVTWLDTSGQNQSVVLNTVVSNDKPTRVAFVPVGGGCAAAAAADDANDDDKGDHGEDEENDGGSSKDERDDASDDNKADGGADEENDGGSTKHERDDASDDGSSDENDDTHSKDAEASNACAEGNNDNQMDDGNDDHGGEDVASDDSDGENGDDGISDDAAMKAKEDGKKKDDKKKDDKKKD